MEIIGLGNRIAVKRAVLGLGIPRPVRCLVVAHQEKGLLRVARLQPAQTFVGNDVGGVAALDDFLPHLVHDGIMVEPLAGQHTPEVEPGRTMRRPFAEVPLADHSCLVAAGAQVLGHVRQTVVNGGVQGRHAVDVIMHAGENGRPTGGTNRIRHIAVIHPAATFGDPVEIRRPVDPAPIAAHCLAGMVVGHNEENIRFFGHGSKLVECWIVSLAIGSSSNSSLLFSLTRSGR